MVVDNLPPIWITKDILGPCSAVLTPVPTPVWRVTRSSGGRSCSCEDCGNGWNGVGKEGLLWWLAHFGGGCCGGGDDKFVVDVGSGIMTRCTRNRKLVGGCRG